IYVGLIILNFFSECLSRSPSILLANPNFVKKINFPLEIYPFVIIGSALFYFFINSLILTLLCFVILGTLYSSILLLPLLFIPLIFVTLGLSWFLSSLGVFVRDVTHFMVFFLQIVMYLSPIFYSINALPEKVQKCLLANPLTFIIEQARQLIIFGHLPNWSGLGIYFLISIVIASGGFIWFQKTRERFADVL
ncbi:MAG: ABC transporter permease, partial [Proteobacteria bacterium]|nr:ABC transporter permease [Pseudomonadota bacterium]